MSLIRPRALRLRHIRQCWWNDKVLERAAVGVDRLIVPQIVERVIALKDAEDARSGLAHEQRALSKALLKSSGAVNSPPKFRRICEAGVTARGNGQVPRGACRCEVVALNR